MDVDAAVVSIEAALSNQLTLAGNDPEVVAVSEALIAALGPALRQAAMDLGQQAAIEVGSQLPNHEVSVVIYDGDPTLSVSSPEQETFSATDYEARLTLRLPEALKKIIETNAADSGDSVNTWVVKNLSSSGSRPTSSKSGRIQKRIET